MFFRESKLPRLVAVGLMAGALAGAGGLAIAVLNDPLPLKLQDPWVRHSTMAARLNRWGLG
jgi:hypothetical protein